ERVGGGIARFEVPRGIVELSLDARQRGPIIRIPVLRHNGGGSEEGTEVLADGRRGHQLAGVRHGHRQEKEDQQPLTQPPAAGARHGPACVAYARLVGVSRIMMVALSKACSSNHPTCPGALCPWRS